MFNFYSTPKIKNIERNEIICKRVKEHLDEICEIYDPKQIIMLALQGSQNYELDTEYSDVDTKCILVPNLDDLVFNHKPISHTHVRANNEHIDCTDIRLYFQSFKKQNLNFIEILYSPWIIINTDYEYELKRLIQSRDLIANYNPNKAVMTMYGIACNKFHALEKLGGIRENIIKQYGYDGKQLSHLLRIEEFLRRYINGEPYASCMVPKDKEYIIKAKLQEFSLEEARIMANRSMEIIEEMRDRFLDSHEEYISEDGEEVLNYIQKSIMTTYLKKEVRDPV